MLFFSEVNGCFLVHNLLFLLSTAAVQAVGARSATCNPLWELAWSHHPRTTAVKGKLKFNCELRDHSDGGTQTHSCLVLLLLSGGTVAFLALIVLH